MFFLTILSETLLYLCFSLLAGTFILKWIPVNAKPHIQVSTSLQLLGVLGIAFLSFIPLIQIISHVANIEGIGSAVESVLLSFRIGNAWLFTFVISIVTAFYITLFGDRNDRLFHLGRIFLLLLLAIGVAWSSHAGTMDGMYGIAIHAIHFLAVTVWVGILLLVSWFSKNTSNWLHFLKWFHPTAITCFFFIVVSGILLMNTIFDGTNYTDTFLASYGQSLLLKHLFIVPLLVYALINGFWVKRRLQQDSSFNPKPWVRVEFCIIFILFVITGAMNEQSPPMNIESLIEHGGYAPLLNMFYNSTLEGTQVSLILNDTSIFFGGLALLCLAMSLYLYRLRKHAALSFLVSILFVITGYFAVIQSITII